MNLRLVLGLFLAVSSPPLTAVAAAPSPIPSTPATASVPTPPSDAAVTGWARDWLRRLQTGNIDRSQLSDAMNAALTPDLAKQLVNQLGPLGDPTSFNLSSKQSIGGLIQYIFRIHFDNGIWNEIFVLDGDNKVAGLRLMPVQ